MTEQPSDPKHTAGPWAWDRTDWWGVLNGPEVDGVRQDVCAFNFRGRSEWPHPADRALIAAAPDLLAACERLCAWYETHSKQTLIPPCGPFVEAEWAIAKAKEPAR